MRRPAALPTLLLFSLGAVPAAAQICGEILLEDSTLSADLSCPGTALILGADGITLDCAGHTLQGSGVGTGVTGFSLEGVTIQNCIVRAFEVGVDTRSRNSTLWNNVAEGSLATGFRILNADGSYVAGNVATHTDATDGTGSWSEASAESEATRSSSRTTRHQTTRTGSRSSRSETRPSETPRPGAAGLRSSPIPKLTATSPWKTPE